MSTKKPCKNHPNFTFTGKESSPLGLGYSAEAEDPGTVMEGRDKTMWMVGIRNGVNIWNRVPTQIVASVTKPLTKEDVVLPPPVEKKRAAPKKKEQQPVAQHEEEAQQAPPPPEPAPQPEPEPVVIAPPPPAKKRAAPKKKKEEPEPEQEEEQPAVAAPVKKRAPPKKKTVAPVAQEEEEPAAPKKKAEVVGDDKKKKAPNDFNIYMSFRTDQLKTEHPEYDHKERFRQASLDWKTLDADRKKEIIEQARAWIASRA